MLRAGWVALCKLVADNATNPESFRNIITLCNELAVDNEENPDLKTSMTMSRGKVTARNYRRLQLPRQPSRPEDLASWSHGTKPLEHAPPPPPQPPLPFEPPPPRL